MLVHVDGLVFPTNFLVVDIKGDTSDSMILGFPFLVIGKALIYMETTKLNLKFNKEKLVFNVYERTSYVDDLETCYQMEENGSKVDKGKKKGKLFDTRAPLHLTCLRHGPSS